MKIKELFEETSTIQKWLSKWEHACRGTLDKYAREMRNYDVSGNDVYFHGNLYILDDEFLNENLEIPVQVSQCRKLHIATTNITSFKNCPKKIVGSSGDITDHVLLLKPVFGNKSEFNNLRSLEGITPEFDGNVDFTRCPNLSYSRADKHIKALHGALKISQHYKGPLLSLLKVEGLTSVYNTSASKIDGLDEACEIITKHLRGNRNVLNCQEELIDNNLEVYAQL